MKIVAFFPPKFPLSKNFSVLTCHVANEVAVLSSVIVMAFHAAVTEVRTKKEVITVVWDGK